MFSELVLEVVIEAGGEDAGDTFPAGVGEVLRALNLRAKASGTFRLAPRGKGKRDARSATTTARSANASTPSADLIFVGEYGSGAIFVSPLGVGIHNPDRRPDGPRIVAPDFAGFLLAQANAYDACKAHIVGQADEADYRQRQEKTARTPRSVSVDVAMIFEAQIKA